jgi:hypothetical protein
MGHLKKKKKKSSDHMRQLSSATIKTLNHWFLLLPFFHPLRIKKRSMLLYTSKNSMNTKRYHFNYSSV